MSRVGAVIFMVAAALCQGGTLEPKIVKKEVVVRPREVVVTVLGADLPAMPRNGKATVEAVKAHWQRQLDKELPLRPDLIVFPEICDQFKSIRGEAKRAWLEERGDAILLWMQELARQHQCYIAYPTHRDLAPGRYSNCTIFIDREGDVIGIYDKNYPTINDMNFGTLPGPEALLITTDFGTLGGVICFDLNFWELLERYAAAQPDVLVFSSYYHGGLMQSVWAYRCQAWFLGSAIGRLESTVLNPVGEVTAKSTCYYDNITTTINTNCRLVHLDFNRAKLSQLSGKYGRRVTMHDPGNLGSVLLTSHDPELPIDEVIRDLALELWSDYYRRSSDARFEALK